jgi:hypothetical protein
MSPAQWLIVTIGAVVSTTTFMLMRYPQHRREEYRGEPFSSADGHPGPGRVFAIFRGRCVLLSPMDDVGGLSARKY